MRLGDNFYSYFLRGPCNGDLHIVQSFRSYSTIEENFILGNPGAIFSSESLLKVLNSPWELILTEPVPEVVEFHSADWAEKYFSAQSARSSSRVTLSPSYTKLFSSSIDLVAWPVQREGCRGRISEKIYLTKSRKSQALTCGLGMNTLPSIFSGDLSKVYRKFLWPLQGPRNYIDRTWERSASYSARTFSCSCYRAKRKWSSTIDMSGDTPPLICI